MCKMYKNTLNGSLGESLSSMEWKITKISLELNLHILHPPPAKEEVLALRVVFRYEALGVFPRVDGSWIELAMPERSRGCLMGDHTGSKHCRLCRLTPWLRCHPWSETKHWVGEVSILVVDSCVRLRKEVVKTISFCVCSFSTYFCCWHVTFWDTAPFPLSTKEGPSNSTLVPCRKDTLFVIPPSTFGLQQHLKLSLHATVSWFAK